MRAQIADPEYVTKARAAAGDEIVNCVGGMECFVSAFVLNRGLTCTVNPAAGRSASGATGRSWRRRGPLRGRWNSAAHATANTSFAELPHTPLKILTRPAFHLKTR